jgi:hypothetical protein
MSIDPSLAPHDDERDEDLAQAWIARQRAWIEGQKTSDTSHWESLSWTWDRFSFLTDYLPDKAWRVIKLIVSIDSSAETIDELFNGPIYDLLNNFGIEMIDIVKDEINRLPELAPLLAHAQELDEIRVHWVPSEFEGRARDGSIGQELAPKDDERDDDLARAWIAYRQAEGGSDRYNALYWTWERITYLTEYLPHKAWRVILLIWAIDQSERVMQILSAGPVEDLLARHGDGLISLVEAEARHDPSFAKVLGGVWKNNMTDEVWARVQAVWDRRGWDGIPEE